MKYTCKYYGGGGTEYDGGIWEIKETTKIIKFEQIEKSFFNPVYTKFTNKNSCIKDNEDKTFTAYPYGCGIPYYFEPIL